MLASLKLNALYKCNLKVPEFKNNANQTWLAAVVLLYTYCYSVYPYQFCTQNFVVSRNKKHISVYQPLLSRPVLDLYLGCSQSLPCGGLDYAFSLEREYEWTLKGTTELERQCDIVNYWWTAEFSVIRLESTSRIPKHYIHKWSQKLRVSKRNPRFALGQSFSKTLCTTSTALFNRFRNNYYFQWRVLHVEPYSTLVCTHDPGWCKTQGLQECFPNSTVLFVSWQLCKHQSYLW